MGANLYGWTLL